MSAEASFVVFCCNRTSAARLNIVTPSGVARRAAPIKSARTYPTLCAFFPRSCDFFSFFNRRHLTFRESSSSLCLSSPLCLESHQVSMRKSLRSSGGLSSCEIDQKAPRALKNGTDGAALSPHKRRQKLCSADSCASIPEVTQDRGKRGTKRSSL